MNKTTARIIVTLQCNRDCDYCVNKQPGILDQAIPLTSIFQLRGYTEICLTGGEPLLLDGAVLENFINMLYTYYPIQAVYLYTSYAPTVGKLSHIIDIISGITFTLHSDIDLLELGNFYRLQADLYNRPGGSHRLKIHEGITTAISIIPSVWRDIQLFNPQQVCQVPEHEDLYIMTPGYLRSLGYKESELP